MKNLSAKFAFCICLVAGISIKLEARQTQNPPRPNIILILADDLGYGDLSAFNNPYVKTPHLDALVNNGWKFTNAYVNAPNCAPSRACLMSGRFTPAHQVYTVGTAERGRKEDRKLIPVKNRTVLDTSFYTMAEMLQNAGYYCSIIGKWHLGEGNYSAIGQGFDESAGGNKVGGVSSHFGGYKKDIPGFDEVPDSVFLADAMTARAIESIRMKREKPYFLYLPYYSVHTPIQAPAEKVDKYRKNLTANSGINPAYAAMVENLDENVGKIVAAVREKGELESTLFVFLSDNGPLRRYTAVYLRGEKGSLYDGGIKTPLIMNWQGHMAAGKVISEPVSAVDLYPTFATLAGADVRQVKLDGQTLTPLLSGNRLPQQKLIWHFPAYLEGSPKSGALWRETPASAIRMGDWKLVFHYETGQYELFDIKADPKELHNLFSSNKKKADVLKSELDSYLRNMQAFIPGTKNPDYRAAN